MSTENLEECKVFLRKLDEDTRDERAKRRLELQLITTGGQALASARVGLHVGGRLCLHQWELQKCHLLLRLRSRPSLQI